MLYINITFVIRFVKIKKNPPSSHTHTHKPTYLCFITCLLIFQIKRLNGYYTLYVKLEHLIGGPPPPNFFKTQRSLNIENVKILDIIIIIHRWAVLPKLLFSV